jgi:hypothetical protein
MHQTDAEGHVDAFPFSIGYGPLKKSVGIRDGGFEARRRSDDWKKENSGNT